MYESIAIPTWICKHYPTSTVIKLLLLYCPYCIWPWRRMRLLLNCLTWKRSLEKRWEERNGPRWQKSVIAKKKSKKSYPSAVLCENSATKNNLTLFVALCICIHIGAHPKNYYYFKCSPTPKLSLHTNTKKAYNSDLPEFQQKKWPEKKSMFNSVKQRRSRRHPMQIFF